jgi:integrase/recombinase XerD
MDAAIKRFLDYLEGVQNRAKNTILAYRADLYQLSQVLEEHVGGPVFPGIISADLLSEYVSWLTNQGYQPSTVSRKMAAVRSFIEYLSTQEREVDPSLLAGLQPPPTPKRRPRVLTREEVRSLINAPREEDSPRAIRDAALLALLYATGMRAAELVSLDVGDVDVFTGRLRKDSAREGPLPLGVAYEPLRRYLREGRPQLLKASGERSLFLNQRGQRLSRQGLWLVVKKWARREGLGEDVSPHTLRHSLAYHMLREGKTRRQVQRKLGLASPSAIRVYPRVHEQGSDVQDR